MSAKYSLNVRKLVESAESTGASLGTVVVSNSSGLVMPVKYAVSTLGVLAKTAAASSDTLFLAASKVEMVSSTFAVAVASAALFSVPCASVNVCLALSASSCAFLASSSATCLSRLRVEAAFLSSAACLAASLTTAASALTTAASASSAAVRGFLPLILENISSCGSTGLTGLTLAAGLAFSYSRLALSNGLSASANVFLLALRASKVSLSCPRKLAISVSYSASFASSVA